MIISLVGGNSFALMNRLRKLVDTFVKEYGDLAVERIDGEEVNYEKIQAAIESMPFLSVKKLVIIQSFGSNKQTAEKLDELLSGVDDATDVIFVEPKPDKRGTYYKTLKKKTDLEEFGEPDEQSLARWLVQEAKSRDASLSIRDANYLMGRVGAVQQLLANELTKLIAYNPKVTAQTIELLTEPSPEGTIFNLLDAAFSGNTKRAMELYESQRAQKVEPQAILAMITWQLYPVSLVKAAGNRGVDEISRDSKLSPFVVRKSKTIADRLSSTQLQEILDQMTDLDRRLKSESIDADEVVRYLLLELAAK